MNIKLIGLAMALLLSGCSTVGTVTSPGGFSLSELGRAINKDTAKSRNKNLAKAKLAQRNKKTTTLSSLAKQKGNTKSTGSLQLGTPFSPIKKRSSYPSSTKPTGSLQLGTPFSPIKTQSNYRPSKQGMTFACIMDNKYLPQSVLEERCFK